MKKDDLVEALLHVGVLGEEVTSMVLEHCLTTIASINCLTWRSSSLQNSWACSSMV